MSLTRGSIISAMPLTRAEQTRQTTSLHWTVYVLAVYLHYTHVATDPLLGAAHFEVFEDHSAPQILVPTTLSIGQEIVVQWHSSNGYGNRK